MTETIKTIDLVNNEAIDDRNISVSAVINAIDVNQSDGSFLTVESNSDGEYLGRVTVYPQDMGLAIENPHILTSVNRGGNLHYTADARFDYVDRKLWIADAGNHRVIKIDINTYDTDLIIDDLIYYPHSLAIDFSTGALFVKGYSDLSATNGIIYYLKRSGLEVANFDFSIEGLASSSSSSSIDSSSSSSQDNSSSSSSLSFSSITSSSSSGEYPPTLPSSRSMAFDYVRSRMWWVNESKVYLLDTRSNQIKSYNLQLNGFYSVRTIDIDLSTGNAFIIARDVHSEWFLVQMNRDNNQYLGKFNI
jgi:hypothetical protein